MADEKQDVVGAMARHIDTLRRLHKHAAKMHDEAVNDLVESVGSEQWSVTAVQGQAAHFTGEQRDLVRKLHDDLVGSLKDADQATVEWNCKEPPLPPLDDTDE